MDLFKLAEELYDGHQSMHGDGDHAWDAAKDQAKEIIDRQRDQEDRQNDLWSGSSRRKQFAFAKNVVCDFIGY